MITNINSIPKNTSGIYKIIYDNGKIYIGQSLNIRKRAQEHNNKSLYPCDAALQRHNAIIIILERVTDFSLLDAREALYIKQYDATNRNVGYNLTIGGDASGKRGVENQNAMFSQDELDDIVDLLINHTELSLLDIANKYHVDSSTIFRISRGKSYVNPKLQYPLRSNNHDSMRKNRVLDYFHSIDELIQLKEDLLYRWDLTIEDDLLKKYQIPLRILRDINNGKRFQDMGNYTYPIRKKNTRNNHNFSIEDVKDILNLLRNTNESMTIIGLRYSVSRDTISNINCGRAYVIKQYDYPARKIKND